MQSGSTVDAVIFKGGYGIDYAEFAGKQVEAKQSGVTVKVTPTTKVAQTLQPRFVAGNPPDVIDNSGAGLIGINTIRDQLAELTDVIEAKNYEGTVIKDTLYPGVTEPGTFDGKFIVLNYALTVYALWYSASLFEQNGWTVPKTYDEMLALGKEAKGKGKYLLGWGKEAATYYQTMAIGSAIKEGGDEVRLALENLKPDCWSLPPVQDVFNGLKKIIDAGYVKPGGSGTAVHGRSGPVERRRGLHPLSVGRLDRERDEEPDEVGVQDDGRARADRIEQLEAAVGGAALDSWRGLHRPVAGQECRRWQGVPARDALQGCRGELRQDQALLDHRQGHGACRRVRVDGTAIPDQDARGGRVEHLLVAIRRPLWHEH